MEVTIILTSTSASAPIKTALPRHGQWSIITALASTCWCEVSPHTGASNRKIRLRPLLMHLASVIVRLDQIITSLHARISTLSAMASKTSFLTSRDQIIGV